MYTKGMSQSTAARMNVHLFLIFGRSADDSPVAQAIRGEGVNLTVFCDKVELNFPDPIRKALIGWTSLLWFSMRCMRRSMESASRADVVVVNSHFDILVFVLFGPIVRRLPGARTDIPPLVLPGFIFTQNLPTPLQQLKQAYYGFIVRQARVVICHSKQEVQDNRVRFRRAADGFVFLPYGLHVRGRKDADIPPPSACDSCLSAGRSGRDYPLLAETVAELSLPTTIISDGWVPPDHDALPECVEVRDQCYGTCFLQALRGCRFVVIPLTVTDISAGQMVLMQAMAHGRPVVITRTTTTQDYVSEEDGVIFVEPNDGSSLQAALMRLRDDPELCDRLGARAADVFDERFSIECYGQNLVHACRLAHGQVSS